MCILLVVLDGADTSFVRDKFVQFEAYAEKLSAEAIDLRNKINKEQRESRRLTSIVTMTAQEKAKLQARTLVICWDWIGLDADWNLFYFYFFWVG